MTGVKLGRALWLSIAVWVVLLIVLIVALNLLGIDANVGGGVLGAFCGGTLVVAYTAWERSAKKQ